MAESCISSCSSQEHLPNAIQQRLHGNPLLDSFSCILLTSNTTLPRSLEKVSEVLLSILTKINIEIIYCLIIMLPITFWVVARVSRSFVDESQQLDENARIAFLLCPYAFVLVLTSH